MRPRKYYTVLEFTFLCFVLNYIRGSTVTKECLFTNYLDVIIKVMEGISFLFKVYENVTFLPKKVQKGCMVVCRFPETSGSRTFR